jgi:dihydropteroate synthase
MANEQKPQDKQATDAEVVADMQRFFHEHGYYRAEDVQRILGDPVGGVTITTQSNLIFSRSGK